jgi:hypothetical protein
LNCEKPKPRLRLNKKTPRTIRRVCAEASLSIAAAAGAGAFIAAGVVVLIMVLTRGAALAGASMSIFIIHLDNLLSLRNGLRKLLFSIFSKLCKKFSDFHLLRRNAIL